MRSVSERLRRPRLRGQCVGPFAATALLLPLMQAGCDRGPAPIEVAQVTGKVLYQGKPVERATVRFHQQGAPVIAAGATNAEGTFRLTTYVDGDGAPVGSHAVSIYKDAPPPAAEDLAQNLPDLQSIPDLDERRKKAQEMANDRFARATAAAKLRSKRSLLPFKYFKPETSGLNAEVKSDSPNEFEFVLED